MEVFESFFESPVSIICPACSTVFIPRLRDPIERRLAQLNALPWRIILLSIVGGMLVYSVARSVRHYDSFEQQMDRQSGASVKTQAQQLEDYRSQAKNKLPQAVSRELVGFHRIVDSYIFDSENHPSKWKAEVTAEFINKNGGIERTNLPFVFNVGMGILTCQLDIEEQSKRDKARFEKELERIKSKY
jgi:hypothetical protein